MMNSNSMFTILEDATPTTSATTTLEFQSTWHMYLLKLGEAAQSPSVDHVCDIHTVADFWNLFNHLDFYALDREPSVWVFVRGARSPIWTAEENKLGGCWSMLIPKRAGVEVFQDIAMSLIGESVAEIDKFTSFSIAAKRGVFNIKLFTDNCEHTKKLGEAKNVFPSDMAMWKHLGQCSEIRYTPNASR